MKPVSLVGVGLWTPGLPSVDHWLEGRTDPDARRPSQGWIAPRQQRRATPLTLMESHALVDALKGTGLEAGEVALLTSSVGGELVNTFANLDLLVEDPPSSSPLRFGNSVHNASLGHLSISSGNTHFASAIAAPRATATAMGLLEAAVWVSVEQEPSAVVIADETWRARDWAPLAVAFVLAPAPTPGTLGTITGFVREPGTVHHDLAITDAQQANPSSTALHTLGAFLAGRSGTVPLAPAGPHGPAWSAAFEATP